jgi:hypothetical protein
MAFTIPEGLHLDLNPLAWLVGTWRGKGRGEYEGIEPFEFAHEVVFSHDGRPFLNYHSRSWIIDEFGDVIRPGASETGFWRVKPNSTLEVVIAHNTGITEGWLGRFEPAKIQLVLDKGYSAPSAKVVTDGSRLYGLVEGGLFFAYDMAAEGKVMQPHIWSTLPRSYD